jgi:hypothetical protein
MIMKNMVRNRAQLRYYPNTHLEGLRKPTETPYKDNQSLDRIKIR